MASITHFVRAWASFFVILNILPLLVSSAACPHPDPSTETRAVTHPFPPELKVFEYVPIFAPASLGLSGKPLQYNGSVPGASDTDEHVGWFFGAGATHNKPVDLLYLDPVPGAEGTYAVRNGWSNNPKILTDTFTITQFHANTFVFGWKGTYGKWFVCGGTKSGFYGLYYGKPLKGCSKNFFLQAKYL